MTRPELSLLSGIGTSTIENYERSKISEPSIYKMEKLLRTMGSRMLPARLLRNEEELAVIEAIAQSGGDGPVLMLNLNRYKAGAGFPGKGTHGDYIAGLEKFLPAVGGQILWRHPVYGQAVGEQNIDEILAAWYPSHKSFLNLSTAPGAAENYRLRGECVEYAVIHRCPGNRFPFRP